MPQQEQLDVVQHPTLGTLKFPKSMPPEQRNQIVAEMEAQQEPPGFKERMAALATKSKAQMIASNAPKFTREREAAQATTGFGKAVKGAGFGPQNIEENLRLGAADVAGMVPAAGSAIWEGLKQGTDPMRALTEKLVLEPSIAQGKQAVALGRAGRYSEAAGHALATIPGIGPPTAALAEQAGTGDVGGAIARGVGQVETGIVGAKAIGAVAPKVVEMTGRGVRSAAGVGEGFTEAAVKARNAEAATALEKYNESVSKTKEATFDTALQNAVELKTSVAKRAAVAAENEARWQEAVKAYDDAVTARAAHIAQKNVLRTSIESDGVAAAEAAKTAYANEKARLNPQYDAIKQQFGDVPLHETAVKNIVKQGEAKIEGSPENIKLFREILRGTRDAMLEEASVFKGAGQLGRAGGRAVPLADFQASRGSSLALNPEVAEILQGAPNEISFRDAHGFYKELGGKLGAGNLPGDIYHALKTVREGLGKELQRVADANKFGDQWKTLQNDWHRMESTFADRGSIAGGGSPIANMLAVENQLHGFKFSGHLAAAPLVGKGAKLAAAMLEEYKTLGTQPEIAARIRTASEALKEMGNTPAKPKLPVRKDKPLPQMTAGKPLPEPPEKTNVPKLTASDVKKLKAEEVAELSERLAGIKGWHPYFDLAALTTALTTRRLSPLTYPIARRIAGYGLGSKTMAEFLSETTKRDVKALEKQK
jgi:hypothetical protein